MNDNAIRNDLLNALAELSKVHPEWRLGQTIANLATSAGHMEDGAIWDLADGEALAAAQRLLERRTQQVPP